MSYQNLKNLEKDVQNQMTLMKGLDKIPLLAVALAEEVGEVCGVVKKHYRDGANIGRLRDELGDVLWYLVAFSEFLGTDLDELARLNQEKLAARRAAKAASDATKG